MQRQTASWVILREGKAVLETYVFPFGLKPGFTVVPILPYLHALARSELLKEGRHD